ncbi:excinuclease ABC subunit C [Candidatus Peregrinibacteria bacterium CG10_big_fil_rev_8_21_14_0_10_42_8]|nr:MAG: excinuclease ABC subunit C [Candidatus Peregrinibacteria bacterium CG10_big_fil_rev_8_21_14_0_10_42_8]
MWQYTYILENNKGYQYVGITDDLDARLARHNRGEISSTAKYVLWKIVNFTAFPTRKQAADYETFLKSGSGTVFRHKRLSPKRQYE